MTKTKSISDAHQRVFKLDVEEVMKIVKRGKPLTADELEKYGPDEFYLADQVPEEPALHRNIPLPAEVGDRIFPNVVLVSPFFCWCSSYTWCLEIDEFGRLRYVLKCNYWCIPQFQVSA
ncbi:hypothetical protein [Acaryochloris marina]|uniref:Uncharacterized protein n=1 Tax=Acaryochloris marina (strain MBIC 11017) TaxID=329726 RepID=A8ZLT4_ACAM1|nr:hypothetical protein [Acaryochloris marina]ABW32111.1 hypothetical protein AM1_B0393 [Acaryochloris marina MBIC11017]